MSGNYARHFVWTLGISKALVLNLAILLGITSATVVPRPAIAENVRPTFVIEREELELSGVSNVNDLLYTRGGGNIYGIGGATALGWRNTVFLVNGRPIPNAAVSFALEFLPISAIERIEILGGSRSTTIGENAIGGAVNIVLRSDFEGTELRSGFVRPRLKGGDAGHASIVWGGPLGEGHLMIGVDVARNQEIQDADREYRRAKYNQDGPTEYADTAGVSYLGSTVFYLEGGKLKSATLGECDGDGFVEILNPGGAEGTGCGFAYADISWMTGRLERDGVFVRFDHPLGDRSEVYLEARYGRGNHLFRYAPPPALLRFGSGEPGFTKVDKLLPNDVNIAGSPVILLGHRFLGHGNRDWEWGIREHDVTLGFRGELSRGIEYDLFVRNYRQTLDEKSNTFVDEGAVREQIEGYDLTNPLSDDDANRQAIEASSVSQNRIGYSNRRSIGVVLSGKGMSLWEGGIDWKVGAETEYRDLHNKFSYLDTSDNPVEESDVLGTGGRPVSGQRRRHSGFAEVTVPISSRWDVLIAGRLDSFSDVGTTRNHEISTLFRVNEHLFLRGSTNKGEAVPSIYSVNADRLVTYPYVKIGQVRRQVERVTYGNPNLRPFDTESVNFGFAAELGPFGLSVDRFKIDQSNRPSSSTQVIVNLCRASREPDGVTCENLSGAVPRITAPWINSLSRKTSGMDVRLQSDWSAKSIDYTFDTRWVRITSSKSGAFGRMEDDPLVPRDQIHATIRASKGNLTAAWSVNAVSKLKSRIVDDYYPSWMGHDVSMSWRNAFRVNKLVLTGGILNVFDKGPSVLSSRPDQIASSYDAARGRTFFLTTKLEL